jgi:hypothetical protein
MPRIYALLVKHVVLHHWGKGRGPLQSEIKKKHTDFVVTIPTVLCDLRSRLNQLPKLADDWDTGILKNRIKTYEYGFCLFKLILIFPVT